MKYDFYFSRSARQAVMSDLSDMFDTRHRTVVKSVKNRSSLSPDFFPSLQFLHIDVL